MKLKGAEDVKLTQYSHGAGCGCKISPKMLDGILQNVTSFGNKYPRLLTGNKDRDDAAVMDLGDGTAIISTTDFFMPIVDDAITFGKIAAANAISDVYAMGGKPILAIAILGWPINVLSGDIAGKVIEGANQVCDEAGIPLAGGHSIDAPEPIFGLAVTGRVAIDCIKQNGGAKPGDVLFLTKPLGIGILTTAVKKGLLNPKHANLATDVMLQLNSVGEQLGKIAGVHAMTDVTGFGLGGHLVEMCKASGTSAAIEFERLPLIDPVVMEYIEKGCIPGGTQRNFDSYGDKIGFSSFDQRSIICDPQTSGGLLIAADADMAVEVEDLLKKNKVWHEPIGRLLDQQGMMIYV